MLFDAKSYRLYTELTNRQHEPLGYDRYAAQRDTHIGLPPTRQQRLSEQADVFVFREP